MKRTAFALFSALTLGVLGCGTEPAPKSSAPVQTKTSDIMAWKPEPTTAVVRYGPAPAQVAELRLPTTPGPHRVVVVIHGGCWQAEFDRTHAGKMSAALVRAGYAVWTIEYRKLGEPGGGWPGTFQDVGDAIELLRTQEKSRSLDLSRLVLVGHSAGAQLALWYAKAGARPSTGPLARSSPLPIHAVVSLAGMTNLAAADTACGESGAELVGGRAQLATRAAEASPLAMVPIGVRQFLLHGVNDHIVPIAHGRAYTKAAIAAGDSVIFTELSGIGHFDLINPDSPAWPAVLNAIREGLSAADSEGRRKI